MGALYRHTGVALLRAAALPLAAGPAWWPDPDDEAECRRWMAEVWSKPSFAETVRDAAPGLADRVGELLPAESSASARQVRRATLSTARYLLRAIGRPTPFGLFAGVADVKLGTEAGVRWGPCHRPVARVDTEWLADVVDRLEARPDLLDRLEVVFTNLAVRRGGRLQVPHGGPNRVSIRLTPAVETIARAAAAPVRFDALARTVAGTVPGATAAKAAGMLTELVRRGFLITCLRAPMTVTDPLVHVLDRLHEAGAPATTAARLLDALEAVRVDLDRHNTAMALPDIRRALGARVRSLSPAGRTPLAVDLLLDCQVTLPEPVAHELQRAAGVLLRLTRQPAGQAVWRDFHAAFWERYSTGTLVPVTELLDPAIGLGHPAEYPGSMMAPPAASAPSLRDERLLALAWQAMADATEEVVLTDDLLDHLTEGVDIEGRAIAPHVEMSARVHAASLSALQRGEFTLVVAPARAAGTLTSRFTLAATGSGLAHVYQGLPAMTEGAITAQLSFPALYPHTENVCRIPAYLPDVIALGEHRGPDEQVIGLEDLAVTATRDRLHLVSISRRRVVEPLVFHAMAMDKQPPPLARFLAHIARGYAAGWTGFDWGPHASRLLYLPRVRYRRTILSPARWHLAVGDSPDGNAKALHRWRSRWSCPETVELCEEDRSLRLDLGEPTHAAILHAHLKRHGSAVLTETAAPDAFGWIGGHAHEIALPLTSARRPAPNPLSGTLPTIAGAERGRLPGSPHVRWLSARLHTHPERYDEILTAHLPLLLERLGGPRFWFVRYRSPGQSAHLRLRLRLPSTGPDQYAATLHTLGRWAEDLREEHLAGELVLDTYRPEIGRYGTGAALDAAEDVFAADSRLVAATLRKPVAAIHPTTLVVVNMAALVSGFLGPEEGMTWLAGRPVAAAASPGRDTVKAAVDLARGDTLPDVPGWRGEVHDAWQDRARALAAYRLALPVATDVDAVLESLLHMHHNRALGIDPDGEKTCRRLARQAARTWQSLRDGGGR